jgi:CheY-like chemotaxis protein
VLVVDDNRDSADTMRLLVQSMGYDAEAAYDGATALRLTLASPPDLLLLDIGLPGLSGLEVARRIEAEIVDPPKLIAVSGYGQEGDREETSKAGFYAHLSKPVDFDELADLLKRLL